MGFVNFNISFFCYLDNEFQLQGTLSLEMLWMCSEWFKHPVLQNLYRDTVHLCLALPMHLPLLPPPEQKAKFSFTTIALVG